MLPDRVDLAAKLALVPEVFSPRIVAEANGQELRIARLHGAFDRHRHVDADEVFLVLRGRLVIRFDDGDVELSEGQLCVVPRGTPHQPVADEECHVLLFEPAGTRNTGDVTSARTVEAPERI